MQIIDWALIILYMIIMVVVGAYFKTSSSMSVSYTHLTLPTNSRV